MIANLLKIIYANTKAKVQAKPRSKEMGQNLIKKLKCRNLTFRYDTEI